MRRGSPQRDLRAFIDSVDSVIRICLLGPESGQFTNI